MMIEESELLFRSHLRILALGLSFALGLPAHAQIDTTLKSFFPNQIGNYWEYMDDEVPPFLHTYVTTIGDTVMPNGKRYAIFREFAPQYPNYPTYKYFRVDDSLGVWRYYLDASCSDGEYLLYNLAVPDRSLWPVCLDWIPGTQQEYIGLFSTQQDYFPHLQLDTLSKFYMNATIDSATGDTVWNSGFIYRYGNDWLAKGLGLARLQNEAGPVVYLIGAIIDGRRYGNISSIHGSALDQNAPSGFRLRQNFPNPFNPSTWIRYEVPWTANVSIKVYNALGQETATLVHALHKPGLYSVVFDASSHAAGVYFCRLQAAGTILTRKMVLVK